MWITLRAGGVKRKNRESGIGTTGFRALCYRRRLAMASSPRTWRTTAARFAFLFSATLTLSAGILLAFQDPSLSRAAVLSSLGLNLVASVVFALIFSFFSTERQERALGENLDDQFSELSRALLVQIAETQRTYMPNRRYPATDSFDPDFNRDLNTSIASTASYVFRGPSARYVATRLAHVHHNPASVRISMVDPSDESALYRRAADRRLWPSSSGKSNAQLRDEMQDEILMSIVALFDYRHVCPVEIIYTADPSVYRMEMTDDAVYISWYHADASLAKEMPESLRFQNGTFLYGLLQLETRRLFELSKKGVTFSSAQGDDYLEEHLRTVSGRNVVSTEISAWRAEHTRYTAPFADYLRNL
ncbi:hypothetical protein [Streptomyces sp. NPDC088812]|uniref:hypothetical protein n=1 Tax=Streptomyces sp. NPDC088812 TaxID=3365905 RepID=UPI0038145D00